MLHKGYIAKSFINLLNLLYGEILKNQTVSKAKFLPNIKQMQL